MSSGQIKKEAQAQVRWMIRRDMADVLKIELESFDFHWTEEDFLNCLRQRNCIGMVAERDGRVVGFMIYELQKTRLHIVNFAVAAAYRRLGIGSLMMAKLISKLSQQRRDQITLDVRETNLAAQFFFHQQGFRATSVVRDFYDDSHEDAYHMQYSLATEPAETYAAANRIAEFEG